MNELHSLVVGLPGVGVDAYPGVGGAKALVVAGRVPPPTLRVAMRTH